MDDVKVEISEDSKEIKTISSVKKNSKSTSKKIKRGKYAENRPSEYRKAEIFLKYLAKKYQESYDGNMRGLLENDKYLSNDEIELIIEKHLDNNDKKSLEKSLEQIAQNKFDNLEKLAFFPNFVAVIPLLTEGFNKFIEEVHLPRKSQITSESEKLGDVQGKSSNINLKRLNTFFENAPITKKSLDGLIQLHSPNPNRLITAMEEQFFPHILLPNNEKKAIAEGVKNYIKTMSNVVQSGAILMDKSNKTITYLDKVSVLENTDGQVVKADSIKDLSEKISKKGKGITVYQDYNIMYSLLKNFGKNFSQSFQHTQFERGEISNNLSSIEYEMRKLAVNSFVQKLEKVIGKQEGIENLKAQKSDIAQGRFSEMVQINGVEARFYMVKKNDKYLVSLLPKRSESHIQQDLNGYAVTKTDTNNLRNNLRINKQFVGISKNEESNLSEIFTKKGIPQSYITQLKAVLVEQKDVNTTQKKLKIVADKIATNFDGTELEKRQMKDEITRKFMAYTGVLDQATGQIITTGINKDNVPKSFQGVSLSQDQQRMILDGKAVQLSGIPTPDGKMNYEATIAFNPIKQGLTNMPKLVAKSESILPTQREIVEAKKGNKTAETKENKESIEKKNKPEISVERKKVRVSNTMKIKH